MKKQQQSEKQRRAEKLKDLARQLWTEAENTELGREDKNRCAELDETAHQILTLLDEQPQALASTNYHNREVDTDSKKVKEHHY